MTLPLFDRLAATYRKSYDLFFRATDPASIEDISGVHLDGITDLAEDVEHALLHANPIWDTQSNQWGDNSRSQEARQWHLDNLSRVKRRLSQAIIHKKEAYENTCMGKITRFILKLFCSWNNGTTAAIRHAEDFLLRYDSRNPLEWCYETEDYTPTDFWHNHPATWLQQNLNLQNFYNYNPPHTIRLRGGALASWLPAN